MRLIRATLDRIVGGGLAALVLFSPLAFGSVETWAITIIESAIFLLGALALVAWTLGSGRASAGAGSLDGALEGDSGGRYGGSSMRIEPLIAVFIVVVLLQLVPLPHAIVSMLSPRVSTLYERTVPGYTAGGPAEFDEWLLTSDAARAQIQPRTGGAVRAPLSYSPPLTRHWLVVFCAWAVLFIIAAKRFRDAARSRRMIVWITFVGVGVAILGLFQLLTGNTKILWLRDSPRVGARPFGPFVNPNHFAGYMELIVPLALGLLLTLTVGGVAAPEPHPGRRREEEGHLGRWGIGRGQEDDRRPWTETQRFPKAVLLGFLLVLAVASIVLSLSRGGFLATLLTFLIFAKALIPRSVSLRVKPRVLVGALALVVAVIGVAFWLGSGAILERAASLRGAQSDPSFLRRADTWVRSLEMFREHPALGVGLGAFPTAFSGYYPPGTYELWREAHNEYIQLLSEVGVIGTIPAVMALYLFLRLYLVPSVTERGRRDRYLTLGLAMGATSLFLHSLVDFNLQVPAVAFLFVLVGGMLAASRPLAPASEPGRESLRRGAAIAGAVVLAIGAVLVGWGGARLAMAERTAARLARAVPAPVSDADYRRILGLANRQPRVLAILGDSAIAAFDVSSSQGAPLREMERQLQIAESSYRRIASLAPLSAWSWWGLGEVYARRSQIDKRNETFSLDRLLPTGEEDFGRQARLALASFRTAIVLEPNSYEVHDDLASLYMQEGLRSAALGAYRESARIMPIYMRHDYGPIASLEPDVFSAIAAGMEDALTGSSMDTAVVRQTLGDAAYIHGDFAEAERQYRLGEQAATSRVSHESLVYLVGEALRREDKRPEALVWLRRAAATDTMAFQAWRALGDMHVSEGDHCEAFHAYSASLARAQAGQIEDATLLAVREQAACGQRAEAIDQLRSLRSTKPDALRARELLVQLLLESGRGPEALDEARSLSEAAPENGAYRDLLASLEQEPPVPGTTAR